MIDQFLVTIPSVSGRRRKRRVYVYVPDSFEDEPDRRYPVLYMFDGHNVFFDEDATYGKSWGMKDYMDQSGTPMIVVGVECSHSGRCGRLKEYAPFTFDDPEFGHVPGLGSKTMDWFAGPLKQRIDADYPTLPDRECTFIAGSSMGGLMTLYAVTAYNHVYGRAAALSPSLWATPQRLFHLFRTADIAPDTVLYMDYGSREAADQEGNRPLFIKAATILAERGVLLTTRVVPNGDHCEACWEEQIPFFMNTLLYDRE